MRRPAAILVVLLLGLSFALPAERTLMLATTTSVDATGLLDVLADAFAKDTGITLRWIAVGTGAALKQARDGNADVVIVHARKLEDEFLRSGFGVNRRVFARNYFVVVGPPDDPARVAGAASAVEALGRIKSAGLPFVSRGDRSGTHTRELDLWALGRRPALVGLPRDGPGHGRDPARRRREARLHADRHGDLPAGSKASPASSRSSRTRPTSRTFTPSSPSTRPASPGRATPRPWPSSPS